MAKKPIRLKLVSKAGIFFEGEVTSVNFKAGEGWITLQASQGDFLSSLYPGQILVRGGVAGERLLFTNPSSGLAYLKNDQLALFATSFSVVDTQPNKY